MQALSEVRADFIMVDKFETMTREELLNELRGLLFRYEQFRSTTLPTLNQVTQERDVLSLQVARMEARLDQVAADFVTIAELHVEAQADPRSALSQVRRSAIQAYQRALRRDYFTDEPLIDDE